MHSVLLASLLLCTLLTGCTRRVVTSSSTLVSAPNTLVAGTFISGAGRWQHREGNAGKELQVLVDGRDLTLHCSVTQYLPKGGSSGHHFEQGLHIDSPGAPWFIYVEAPGRYWFFDGKDRLIVEKEDSYSFSETLMILGGKLVDSGSEDPVPAELILRLPAELQSLLPKPVAPTGRPSI